MKNSSELIGQLLANVILEYVVLSIILTILISLLINKYTWIIIWENVYILIIYFATIFIDLSISFISTKIIVKNNIFSRNLMQVVDIYKLIIAIIEGLKICFYRLVIGFIGLIIGITRFDETLMPSWINKIVRLDTMTNSIESFISTYHYFSNPIKETMIKFLLEATHKKSMSKAQKTTWKSYFITRLFGNHKNICKKKHSLINQAFQVSVTRK